MDIDIKEIEGRIQGQFALGHAMLFWEDEAGEYAQATQGLDLGGGALVDVTGAELAGKRAILRERPARNLVVYRAGGKPRPEDDFLYDVKLAATPFTCKMEGIWAAECGVPAQLAGALADHGRFFNSKERRAALAESGLDKTSEASLRLAMLAACVGSKADSPRDVVRDVVRRLLAELGRGQDRTARTIAECGLSATLWAAVGDALGYRAPEGEEPTVEDLALKMLQSRCADLLGEQHRLRPDAERILGELASNSRTRGAYDALAREYAEAIEAGVPVDGRCAEGVGDNDTLPAFDGWIVADLLARAVEGTLRAKEAEEVATSRRTTLWFDEYRSRYAAIEAACALFEEIDAYRAQCSAKTTAAEIFDAYCRDWHRADAAYRRLVGSMREAGPGFRQAARALATKADDAYGKFLVDLADRWQLHLLDGGAYPPAGMPSQADFFREHVEKAFPRAEPGKRVGVVVSDAMRYEVGRDLAARLSRGDVAAGRARAKATCGAMACMLPSYTQLGMAALLPAGTMEVDPATANVTKGGEPTDGIANRQKIVEAAVPGAVLVQASTVLEGGLPDVAAAPLVVVYHNAIDKRGDARDTEGEVFAACEDAICQVAAIAGELLRAGCGKVVVTADHGFLYQDQAVEEFNYAVVDGLGDLVHAEGRRLSHGRRFAVGDEVPKSDSLVEYSSVQLSLNGEERFAFPRGVARLRLRGSGARFVHGGASLQENAVPVVTIERAGGRAAAGRTGAQGFLCGRPSITGATVTLDVYQTQQCSEKVAPLAVKVGLYSPDDAARPLCAEEKALELASTAEGSEERKTRVTLLVTDDVDDYPQAVLRISSRIGNTNQYGAEWEQRLSVNRAFGNDFDF